MSPPEQFEYDEQRGFLRRYGFVIGVAVVAVIGVVLVGKLFTGHSSAPTLKPQEFVMIKPVAPPPPPPPPPPPQNEPKQQMMEQAPVDAQEVKPVEQPQAAAPALGTNIQGNGPLDGFGLGRNGNGMIGGGGSGGRGGSRFGWYANLVIKAVGEALRKNPDTRNASFSIKVRIWADVAGRVTRAKLAGSTGNLALDDAIKGGVLTGFQLPEPPPDGLPMPIVMRLTARRPN